MDKEEFALFQARTKIIALETLLDWTTSILRVKYSLLPEPDRSAAYAEVHKKLQDTRDHYTEIAFPELSPELSDMKSAEFQEIFETISKHLEKKICGDYH